MFSNKREASLDGNGNIVIQNSDNSSITVNLEDAAGIRKLLVDMQHDISNLPFKIIQELMIHNKSEEIPQGANVYLSLNIMFETMGNKPTGNIAGVSFGVSVTNTTKEQRYFYEPSFKVSIPLENGVDSFFMTDKHPNNPQFPKRLEYGEPFSAYYNIADIRLFKSLVEKDEDVAITAVVNTTLGEIYFSNPYKLKELIKDEPHMRKGAFGGVLDLK